jgi:hypothetical protein
MIMETRDRSSYPDFPHPGYGHPSDRISKPYSIVFTAVIFFILIFGIAIFQGYRQFETTRHNAMMADRTTENRLADRKPYISNVIQLIVGDKPLAVSMCVPIFDEKG